MKRLLTLILVLSLLAALPAVAEQSFSTFDFVTGSAGGGRFLYYDFPDISLYLPASWEGLYTMEQGEHGVSFYQTSSLEKWAEKGFPDGGFLFELCASEDESYQQLPAYKYLGYSENVGLHFYLLVPSDYPAYMEDEAIRAEYDAMMADIDTIAEMARIAPSLMFYTDNLESTDAGMS